MIRTILCLTIALLIVTPHEASLGDKAPPESNRILHTGAAAFILNAVQGARDDGQEKSFDSVAGAQNLLGLLGKLENINHKEEQTLKKAMAALTGYVSQRYSRDKWQASSDEEAQKKGDSESIIDISFFEPRIPLSITTERIIYRSCPPPTSPTSPASSYLGFETDGDSDTSVSCLEYDTSDSDSFGADVVFRRKKPKRTPRKSDSDGEQESHIPPFAHPKNGPRYSPPQPFSYRDKLLLPETPESGSDTHSPIKEGWFMIGRKRLAK